ncbi:ATPase domain-containing protein [Tychonema sp. BBK16]|uniref:ATPase domain-containing protein n=1 Tax=Tychonema sp. BBK16 TaxID=2699888 RepID=UPI001F40D012|nr:ATPase domain-containing protein [Tychonema sp. BBK16]MCF6371535.1 hypothetical protein [Tychonema sp. BBK16]
MNKQISQNRLSVGVTGLNEVIGGGLIPQRSYLVRGGLGTGKTTLGWHFLTAGVELGEKPPKYKLILTEEKRQELLDKTQAAAKGIDLLLDDVLLIG